MLRHQEINTEQGQTAAQLRVTPEELTKALAAIEAARQTEEGHRESTLPIGDAVRELALDTTPEQIWAQVQAQRAQQKATLQTAPRPKRMRRATVWGLCGLLFFFLTLGVRMARFSPPPEPSMAATLTPASGLINVSGKTLVKDSTGMLRTLAEMPDGKPFRGVLYISSSDETTTTLQDFSNGAGTTYTLIKHQGNLYVRGWVALMSDQAMQQASESGNFQVYNTNNSGAERKITLPIETCRIVRDIDNGMTLSNVHLDEHAWEKW